ncbi:hypothetical protein, partial [Sulfuriflexus sp.]|uniref:hypothetical protein n=1 Tax=Sulfuriflexus sp. TaxID=2015443 RepID=UPI0028CF74D9
MLPGNSDDDGKNPHATIIEDRPGYRQGHDKITSGLHRALLIKKKTKKGSHWLNAGQLRLTGISFFSFNNRVALRSFF